MVYEQRQQAALNDVVAWIEDELREIKAQLSRVGQGADQVAGEITVLVEKVHEAEDQTSAVAARLDDIPRLIAQMAQLRAGVTRAEEVIATLDRRLTEELYPIQLEAERFRQETNNLSHRLGAIERAIEGWSGRFERLEEANRRVQEVTTLLRQQDEEAERRQLDMETRSTRSTEIFKHYEVELSRVVVDVEDLQERIASVDDRNQIYSEALKRLEQLIEALRTELKAQQEVFEKLDLLRAEVRRLEQWAGNVDQVHQEHRIALEDHTRLLTLLDGKDRGFTERLVLLQEDLAALRDAAADQLHRLQQALEHQKRRQLEELQRDLRDLRLAAFRSQEDNASV